MFVLLPRMNMRGPMFAGRPTDCLNHIVTTKFVTFPNPRLEFVVAAIAPATLACVGGKSNARLPVVSPATPE